MTLIGVLKTDGSVHIGADGGVVDANQIVLPEKKLFDLPNGSAAWGFAGSQPVGLAFKTWMDQAVPNAWDDFANDAAAELARVNAAGRQRALEAAAPFFEPVEVLLAGYIGSEGRVLYFDDEGQWSEPPSSAMFIGFGKHQAIPSWYTALALLKDKALADVVFKTVIAVSCRLNPMLGEPPQFRDFP